jgi:hypothetical protein
MKKTLQILNIAPQENPLTPLSNLYKWVSQNNYKTEGEHIIIGGIPVQFLLAYNELVAEALANRVPVTLFDEKTFILNAEYLMAIMLQTWRQSDRERLGRFINEYDYDEIKFNDIISRFDLLKKYQDFKHKFYE